LTAQLGLNDRVTFLPPANDVKAILAAHDILLVPSRFEGLGIVAVEALAAGRIVIASHVGGLPEVVRDGESGLIFSPVTPAALAERLEWCFEHPEEAAPLARAGQAYVAKYFDVKEMAEKYQVVYRSVLSS
ncbi:MAG: glycosyltransferase, partial [Candidatus Magasanikbacteria bacterium]|nr:glycosyltransferase [Candidatus Magasanikbacteria bacterium]